MSFKPATIPKVLAAALAAMGMCAAQEAPDAAWALPDLPHIRYPGSALYPSQAMRQGIEGRVLVAFDITPGGTASRISILWDESPMLAAAAREALSAIHFDVPADWDTKGAWRR